MRRGPPDEPAILRDGSEMIDVTAEPMPRLAPRRPDSHRVTTAACSCSADRADGRGVTRGWPRLGGGGLVTVATPLSVQPTVAAFSPCYDGAARRRLRHRPTSRTLSTWRRRATSSTCGRSARVLGRPRAWRSWCELSRHSAADGRGRRRTECDCLDAQKRNHCAAPEQSRGTENPDAASGGNRLAAHWGATRSFDAGAS